MFFLWIIFQHLSFVLVIFVKIFHGCSHRPQGDFKNADLGKNTQELLYQWWHMFETRSDKFLTNSRLTVLVKKMVCWEIKLAISAALESGKIISFASITALSSLNGSGTGHGTSNNVAAISALTTLN